MARRRYQQGFLRKRGKRSPVWELLWREDYLNPDGSIGRRLTSAMLGPVANCTLRQARKLAEERLRPLNQGRIAPASTIRLGEFVERQFIPNAFPALKPSTQQRYRLTLNHHLLPAFGDWPLAKISTLDIQQFVLQKMASGLGWEMADHFRNLLSRIYEMAKRWNYFAGDNPARGVELPEKRAVREKHILQPEEITRLLAVLPEPVHAMAWTGLLTGMRIGEILALRWRDVDFAAGVIRVERNYYRGSFGSPKTPGSRRTLPLPRELAETLHRFRPASSPEANDSLVFHSRKGTPLSDTNLLHRHLKPAGRKLGLPWLSWHTLRRTHATLLHAAGASPKDTQAQLGHARIATTFDLYAQPLPAQQRAAIAKLARDLLTNVDEHGQPETPARAQP